MAVNLANVVHRSPQTEPHLQDNGVSDDEVTDNNVSLDARPDPHQQPTTGRSLPSPLMAIFLFGGGHFHCNFINFVISPTFLVISLRLLHHSPTEATMRS